MKRTFSKQKRRKDDIEKTWKGCIDKYRTLSVVWRLRQSENKKKKEKHQKNTEWSIERLKDKSSPTNKYEDTEESKSWSNVKQCVSVLDDTYAQDVYGVCNENHEWAINLSIYLCLFFERLCNTWLWHRISTEWQWLIVPRFLPPTGAFAQHRPGSASSRLLLHFYIIPPLWCAEACSLCFNHTLWMKSSSCLIQVSNFVLFCFLFGVLYVGSSAAQRLSDKLGAVRRSKRPSAGEDKFSAHLSFPLITALWKGCSTSSMAKQHQRAKNKHANGAELLKNNPSFSQVQLDNCNYSTTRCKNSLETQKKRWSVQPTGFYLLFEMEVPFRAFANHVQVR